MPLFTGFVNVGLTVCETQRAVMKGSKKPLSLRQTFEKPADFQWASFFLQKLLPLTAPPVTFKII